MVRRRGVQRSPPSGLAGPSGWLGDPRPLPPPRGYGDAPSLRRPGDEAQDLWECGEEWCVLGVERSGAWFGL